MGMLSAAAWLFGGSVEGVGVRARGAAAAAVVVLTMLATVLGAGVASPAYADGSGSYPSTAVAIVNGQAVSGGVAEVDQSCNNFLKCEGKAGVQYYRLALGIGDQATFDFQTTAGDHPTDVCVFSPSVTDYNLSTADCLASAETSGGFGQLQYTAGQTGGYLVAIAVSCCPRGSWAYQMSVHVRSRATPALKLKGPKSAHVGSDIKLHGHITPAFRAKLTLKSKSPAHGWQVAGTVRADERGRFTFSYHLGHAGPHEFRVFFSGKGLYNPAASKTVHVRV